VCSIYTGLFILHGFLHTIGGIIQYGGRNGDHIHGEIIGISEEKGIGIFPVIVIILNFDWFMCIPFTGTDEILHEL
jgi:hypothetical protein